MIRDFGEPLSDYADITALDRAPQEPFEFVPSSDADDVTLQEAVFQALGAASVCWDTMAGAGVFHSERAIDIGEQLLTKIHQLLAPLP